jgi:DNA topoisomerase I, bacterial
MSKNLIIVESPAKVKTIGKFLGKDYMVEASVGHVRDLPVRDLGVDEAQGFAPRYQVIKGKEEVVKRLKAAAKKAGQVFLAPDPDREGEAIAWHVAELIKDENQNLSRIQFNEITPRAVREALEHPRELNERLFDSQQARRVLDRLVGYKISPILWKKVKRGISAGRVQSVALKLIVEREKLRRAFRPEEYWPFKALLAAGTPPPFWTELWKNDGKAVKPGSNPIGSAAEAEALHEELSRADFLVDSVEEKKRKRSPLPPYITSTLQQDANNRLGYPAKKTMTIAQRLYEGVDLGDRGTLALITYMRTDSVRIADEARDAARDMILSRFGKDFLPAKPRAYKTKGSAQDAHEAIRPVDVTLSPDQLKPLLPADQFRIYSLIWQRFVASQMADAEFWDTTVTVRAAKTLWRTKGERLLFPGFLAAQAKVAKKDAESAEPEAEEAATADLPKLAPGDRLDVREIRKEQKFTTPPARYSEASLVKELEELGIGRPSTYAAIISTIQDREYVRLEEKRFAPSELGVTVSDQLSEHFPELMDVGFTADMENKLDAVSEGKQDWTALIRHFAEGFYPLLEKAQKEMTRINQDTGVVCEICGKPMAVKFGKTGEFLGCTGYPDCKSIKNVTRDENGAIVIHERGQNQVTDITCDLCGKPMLVKSGSRGEFLGCSGYPDCKGIKNFTRDENGAIVVREAAAQEVVGKCPKCGKDLLLKTARTGSRFIACSGYPDCDYTEPFRTGVKCPNPGCDGELVEKSSRRGKVFYSCSRYPKCDYATWDWPIAETCPDCGHPVLVRKHTKAKGDIIACPKKGCSYSRPVDE